MISTVVMLGVMLGSHPSSAVPDAQYVPPTLERMIDFMFANGYIDPNDPQQLIDYVRVKDCGLFQKYYRDDFTWNKMKTRIIRESKTLQKDVATHFVMPDNLQIDRYNFETKAFDIAPPSQLRNINSLNVLEADVSGVCDNSRALYGDKALSFGFDIRLQTPLSLYRIPMAEAMAQYILPELSQRMPSGNQKRIVYMLIYFTVDGVMATTSYKTLLGGRVDKIEFFLDQARTQRIKRITYGDL